MTRILVAEDNPVNSALLVDLLEMQGYEVVQAQDGRQALQVARERKPDLILLDMMMPVMDGFEVARALKEDAATRRIPVVALTALAMEGDERRALEAGCDAYVSKPIDTRALPDLVERMLSGGHAPRDVPEHILGIFEDQVRQGGDAIAAALEVLERRPNDAAALRSVTFWAHRLRGSAAMLRLPDLAGMLGGLEATTRRADERGRLDDPGLQEVRGGLAELRRVRAEVFEEDPRER